MARRPLLTLAVLFPVLGGWHAAMADPLPACPVPADFAEETDTTAPLAAALRSGHLTVLAIGSAGLTAPVGPAGHDNGAFPYRMAAALQAARADLHVDLIVRGGRGLAAGDMLPILRSELAAHASEADRIGLVVWQTGTVEAVRSIPPEEFTATLLDGAEAVRAAGASLILVDPQFSGFLQANTDLAPYEQALEQAAGLPGVTVFHRFQLMRFWSDTGLVDLEHSAGALRQAAEIRLHDCLGRLLAAQILHAASADLR